jgi:telomere length regulation protein
MPAAKLAQAALGRGAARGLSWRACERLLRSMFSTRFRRCVSTRHAICDGMLLRRPQPRRVLPALIRIALVDPPVGVLVGGRGGDASPTDGCGGLRGRVVAD